MLTFPIMFYFLIPPSGCQSQRGHKRAMSIDVRNHLTKTLTQEFPSYKLDVAPLKALNVRLSISTLMENKTVYDRHFVLILIKCFYRFPRNPLEDFNFMNSIDRFK